MSRETPEDPVPDRGGDKPALPSEKPASRAGDPDPFYDPPAWLDNQPDWLDDAPPPGEVESWWLDEEGPLDPEGDDREWPGCDQVAAAEAEQADSTEGQALARECGFEDAYLHTKGMPRLPGIEDGPAGGFGQGEILDQAPPSLVLAGHADYASGQNRDFTGVTDDQLAGLLYARRRLLARESWERLMAAGEYIRRRPAPGVDVDQATGMPACWDQGLAGEIRLQLAITRQDADHLLGLAWDLIVKLRATSDRLRDGLLDEDKASVISLYCANLTLAEAQQAEDIVYAAGDDIETMTWGMIRDRIAKAVIQVNPDAARKRRESAARERRIETRPEVSGNAMIAGRELPPAAVLAMDQALTARARMLKRLGVEGGMNELRVQAFLERWGLAHLEARLTRQAPPAPGHHEYQDGSNHHGTGNGGNGDGGTGNGGDGDGDNGDDNGDGNGGRGPRPGDPGPAGPAGGGCACGGTGTSGSAGNGGLAGQIHLTAPVTTLAEMAGRPGVLRGTGPIDPYLTRDLADAASRHPGTGYHFTVTGADGRPIAHACGKPGPGDPARPRTRDKPAKPGNPGTPGRPSRDRPAESWPPGRDPAPRTGTPEPQPTEPQPTQPRPPGPRPGSTELRPPQLRSAELRSTQRESSEPRPPEPQVAELRPPEPARLEIIDRGPPGSYGTWRYTHGGRVIIFEFEDLTGPCDHRHQAAGHDPGKLLRHLTGVLNQTCTNPGCRRPEGQCDYEHSRPWEHDGITCLCAAGPVCRRDHRDKQRKGWKIEGTGTPGWFTWTVPSGRKYLSKPTEYPI